MSPQTDGPFLVGGKGSRKRKGPPASVDTTLRSEGVHVVDGTRVRCCEQGEKDCPCTCHGGES